MEDRTAVVIGGAGGIGSAISTRLAVDGYRVFVAERNLEKARDLAAGLEGEGHGAVEMDVTDAGSVDRALEEVEAQSPPAVLVISSGGPLADLSLRPTVTTLDPDDWVRTVAVNLTGVFLAIRKFGQLRQARPLEHGRIITIGSTSGQMAQDVIDVAYASSKAGLLGLSRQAAFDLAGAGITSNLIAAGVVGTPAFMQNTSEEVRAGAAAGTLVKRLATPEEMAASVAYLASREGGYVTGATLDVNGGNRMA